MWRYQLDGPGAFGSTSWACHRGCNDYTFWRVLPEDVPRVPPLDAPPSWGQQGAWLAQVREQRQLEERMGARPGAQPRQGEAEGEEVEAVCSVM